MLLNRIAASAEVGGGLGLTATEDLDALMDSVRANLARLLNARHGFSQAMPDYGLPAMADMTVSAGSYIKVVQESIRTVIEKYEPRLRRVRVNRVETDDGAHGQRLAFRIEGMLRGRSGQHRVYYETMVSGDGEFRVSE